VESERKRPLERAASRWVDNIKIDVKLTANLCVNWIHVASESDEVAGWCEPLNESVRFCKNRKLLTSEAGRRLVI
jgi:hypothetical protein